MTHETVASGGIPEKFPSISTDRTVGHMLEGVDVDPSAMEWFYEALPHESKPPLAELSVHLSASELTFPKYERITVGELAMFSSRRAIAARMPGLEETLVGPPLIGVYVGTVISEALDKPEEEREQWVEGMLNRIVAHELAHYAQFGGQPDISFVSRARLNGKYAGKRLGFVAKEIDNDSRWRDGIIAGFLGSAVLTGDIGFSGKIAAGAGLLAFAAGHDKRSMGVRTKVFQTYLDKHIEKDARSHEDTNAGIISIGGLKPAAELSMLLGCVGIRQREVLIFPTSAFITPICQGEG